MNNPFQSGMKLPEWKQRLFLVSFHPIFTLSAHMKTNSILNHPRYIVGKKWDPGILDPGPFSAQIMKVEARLGKLTKIREVETD